MTDCFNVLIVFSQKERVDVETRSEPVPNPLFTHSNPLFW